MTKLIIDENETKIIKNYKNTNNALKADEKDYDN
jgi:hypothetical protein